MKFIFIHVYPRVIVLSDKYQWPLPVSLSVILT